MNKKEKKAIEIFTNLIDYLEKWNDNVKIVPNDKKYYKIVLNLISKLEKENEDLKKEKEENKLLILKANNVLLGYHRGYLDGKNLNRNATEIIVKNREFYRFKQEIEFYKREIEFYKREIEFYKREIELYKNANIDK